MEETLIDKAVVEKKNEIVEHKELGMVSDQEALTSHQISIYQSIRYINKFSNNSNNLVKSI